MEASEGDEIYQDIASDEAVRPSVTLGAGSSSPGVTEREPDYGLFREDTGLFQGASSLDNPNLTMIEEGESSRRDGTRPGHRVGLGKGRDDLDVHEPPYEQISVGGGKGADFEMGTAETGGPS